MRTKMILSLPLLALSFAACNETSTPYGKIPQQYVYQAQQYQGYYNGHFRGEPTRLGMFIHHDQPYVFVENRRNNDLLGADCNSFVGNLSSVKGTQDLHGKETLETAKFEFNSNHCGGEQQVLKMDFSDDNQRIRTRLQGVGEDDKNLAAYDGEFFRE